MERLNIKQIKDNDICIHRKDNSFEIMKKSVKKYGQLRPIVINMDNEIIDGHKLYKILVSLDFSDVWVIKVEIENKEQLYCELNINKTELDPVLFFKYVKYNVNIEDHCLPFSTKDLRGFITLLDFNWDSFDKIKSSKYSIF